MQLEFNLITLSLPTGLDPPPISNETSPLALVIAEAQMFLLPMIRQV